MKRTSLLLTLILLAITTAAVAAPLGQFSDNLFRDSSGAGLSLNQWPVKAAIIAVVFLTAGWVLFLGVFRMLVANYRWWPRSAYGFCLGGTLLAAALAGLLLFWDKLVLDDRFGAGVWDQWGLRLAYAAGMVVVVFMLFIKYRGASTAQ